MSDVVGNPEEYFSHVAAQMIVSDYIKGSGIKPHLCFVVLEHASLTYSP